MNIGMRIPLKIDVETLLSMCGVRVDNDGIAEYKARYMRRLEVLRRYRLKHGHEVNARRRLYRKMHNVEVNNKQREYRTANKVRINAYNREYNRLHNAEITARRRARYAEKKRAQSPGSISCSTVATSQQQLIDKEQCKDN